MKKFINIDYFISVQPDLDYYVWQLQVQMNNFKKFNIENKSIILFGYNPINGINKNALKFKEQTDAKIFFYEDNRTEIENTYSPSVRPHILKKFFNENDLLKNKNYLYHDSDILFTKLPKIELKNNNKKIFLSDTISYIGSEYIKSKSLDLFNEMCSIVNIDPLKVSNNENKSGGAQYLISKNTPLDFHFWNKVEMDSVTLFNYMQNTKTKFSKNHPIQSWTSDMWALLWNLWLRNYDTEIHNELNFSWATSHISDWNKNTIYHNAGVTGDRNDLFFKGNYIKKSPFNENFNNISKEFCSYKYVEEIIETGLNLKK